MIWLFYKKLYRKTTVDCVGHIVEVVKKSSTAGLNKVQCYDNGKGFQYVGGSKSFDTVHISQQPLIIAAP